MAQQNTFRLKGIERIAQLVVQAEIRANDAAFQMVCDITEMVWHVAHQKRAMTSSKWEKQHHLTRISLSGNKLTKRVSDPNARLGVPVDTGTLMKSIQWEVKKKPHSAEGKIYTEGVPYAKAMEFGTSKVQARPFMRSAINETAPAVRKVIANFNLKK